MVVQHLFQEAFFYHLPTIIYHLKYEVRSTDAP